MSVGVPAVQIITPIFVHSQNIIHRLAPHTILLENEIADHMGGKSSQIVPSWRGGNRSPELQGRFSTLEGKKRTRLIHFNNLEVFVWQDDRKPAKKCLICLPPGLDHFHNSTCTDSEFHEPEHCQVMFCP